MELTMQEWKELTMVKARTYLKAGKPKKRRQVEKEALSSRRRSPNASSISGIETAAEYNCSRL
ncbi:MAG: hypothetical protein WC625_03865 [Caldisericia bacterium]